MFKLSLFQINILFATFLISLIFTTSTIPLVNRIGKKFGINDYPDPRKVHKNPIVRIGGLSIVLGFIISVSCFFIFIDRDFLPNNRFDGIASVLIIASLCFFILGFVDDIFKVSFLARLTFQIIFSIFVWHNGIAIKSFDLSFLNLSTPIILNDYISLFLTVIWIVAITNAINWIDGLDGLAAGTVSILSIGMIYLSLLNQQYILSMLLLALLGSCIGFLIHNYYPAKILMGDGGSYFIGFLISLFSLKAGSIQHQIINPFIPLTITIIPLFDMTYVILNRLYRGLSPFYPDRKHLHHRLLDKGYSHKNVVLTIYLLNIIVISSMIKFYSI